MTGNESTAGSMYGDTVVACADLAGRAGASGFEIGYVHDDVPVEDAGWYAHVVFKGARIQTDEHRSPAAAALALAERLLSGAQCRCTRQVSLSDDRAGCRWRLVGKRWEPGCNAPAIHVKGKSGDMAAIKAAMAKRMTEHTSPPRHQRRQAKRQSGRKR